MTQKLKEVIKENIFPQAIFYMKMQIVKRKK